MKTLLLTGASGFIGSHLLNGIKANPEYRNYNLVLLTSYPIEGYKCILHQQYTFKKEDFFSAGVTQIDVIIHAGAFMPKIIDEVNLIDKCFSNISSLQHLINNIPNKPEKFIYLSTVDVYGSEGTGLINEDTNLNPVSLYGWSKLYCEKALEAWSKQTNITLQILRIGHIYGSGEQQFQKLIPVTIKKVLLKQNPKIFSNGKELRSFLHIKDAVNAIINAINLKQYVGPINVVSEISFSIKEIVMKIINAIGTDVEIETQENNRNARNLIFDNSKMKKYIGAETVSFENGIKEEIASFS